MAATRQHLQSYIVKLHGSAGTSVTNNSSAMTSYASLEALKAAAGEGWATGKDIYGDVTYVKVTAAAASSKSIAVTGVAAVSATFVQSKVRMHRFLAIRLLQSLPLTPIIQDIRGLDL